MIKRKKHKYVKVGDGITAFKVFECSVCSLRKQTAVNYNFSYYLIKYDGVWNIDSIKSFGYNEPSCNEIIMESVLE